MSLTWISGKTLEPVIKRVTREHLERGTVITQRQPGFVRKGHANPALFPLWTESEVSQMDRTPWTQNVMHFNKAINIHSRANFWDRAASSLRPGATDLCPGIPSPEHAHRGCLLFALVSLAGKWGWGGLGPASVPVPRRHLISTCRVAISSVLYSFP